MLTVGELRIAIDGLPDDLTLNVLLQGAPGEPPQPVAVDRLSIDRDGFLDVVPQRE